MPLEIERKFLVDPDQLVPLQEGEEIRQGFLPTTDLTAVRVRLSGEGAWLTIKGKNVGATRTEFEYGIPEEDARQIIDEFCAGRTISKTRYRHSHGEYLWEIDIFHGDNEGLVVAEVELPDEDASPPIPDWVTTEVTGDPRYYNMNLVDNPFSQWDDNRDH